MKPLAQNSMIQNRYLIVQLIGKGGMGEVYLAIDQRLGSAVALKRTYFKGDETMGSAFEREARILGRLRHPVLPKVIDHFLEGGDQFLVMEHISGDDLAKRLETTKKPFPLNWVMFWADQALDALNYLHSHEPPIIHRDIKPQNLKLTDENHIVLLDFGLSKDFDSVNTGGSSGVGSIVGYSPGFAPMEQVRGTGTDGRSDLYSLSATLYQLLSNVAPPDALARADAMLGGAGDPLEPLNLLNRDVPPAISDVLTKGLSVRQDDRYQSAAEMQKAMRKAYNQGKQPSAVRPEALPSGDIDTTEAPTRIVPSEPAQPTHVPDQVDTGTTMESTIQMDNVEVAQMLRQSDVKTEVIAGAPAGPEEAGPKAEAPVEGEKPAPSIAAAPAAAAPAPSSVAETTGQAKKARSSASGFLIGAVIGLVLLAIAAGGGWYAYDRYYKAQSAVPTPSPQPSPAPEANVAGANEDNANIEVVGSNTAQDSNQEAPTNTATAPSTRQSPHTTTRTTEPPARTGRTPAPRSTPRTNPRDDRTVILQ